MSIRSRMKPYNYYLMNSRNTYGELVLPTFSTTDSTTPTGTIEMDIEVYQQSIKDSILFSGAQFIGIAQEAVTDNTIIDFDGKMLKVLYCIDKGRYKQIYMAEV